jgi:hypothetical protein
MSIRALRKRARRLSKSISRTLGREVSDSEYDSEYDGQLSPYNPDDDPELQERILLEQVTGTRARSPTLMQSQHAEKKKILKGRRRAQREQAAQQAAQQMLLQRQALDFTYSHDVDEIIVSINEYLSNFFGENVNIDIEDPSIRFIVGMIVTSNDARINVYQKIRRSRLLLTSIASFIISRATRGTFNFGQKVAILLPFIKRGITATGSLLLRLGASTGRAAKRTAYSVATSMRNYFTPGQQALQQGMAASPPRQSMYHVASAAYDSVATGLPDFFSALSDILEQVYVLLAQCVPRATSMAVSLARSAANTACAYFTTTEEAVEQAVVQVVPQPHQGPDLECSICLSDALPGQGAVLTRCGHRFHQNCIQQWVSMRGTCPMCRNENPRPFRNQGGGGSRKSKSRSNSKTRRLRKYRSKPRKSYKSKKPRPSSSSRRK